jgi:hypothetical protein
MGVNECNRLLTTVDDVRLQARTKMGEFKRYLKRAERFRANMAGTIAALVLVGTLSLRYPLVFLGFLVVALVYAIYRIVNDRKSGSAQP